MELRDLDFRNIVVLDPQQNKDLELVDLGEEAHEKPWSFGPAVRDYYLIHYIMSGKGVFRTQDRTYQLSAGSGFLITPEEITYYGADPSAPWHYIWIGFTGEKAKALLGQAGLSKEQPIFSNQEAAACFRRMVDASDRPGKTTLLLSAVYQFLACWCKKRRLPVSRTMPHRRLPIFERTM